MSNNVYPRSFSHIGLSVTDLDGAVKFYTEVMGWYLVMPPTTIEEDAFVRHRHHVYRCVRPWLGLFSHCPPLHGRPGRR